VEEQNRALIRTLYDSLDRHDGEGMAACYAPTAQFRDPAFGELSGAEAGDMWRMLTGRAEDLSVELADHDANDETGTAHWIAHYTFTDTGRPVVNDVRARFRFAAGLIVEHVDEFSFFGWSRQALGPLGLALGWTPLLPILVRRRTRGRLDAFRAERARGR
jgi:ketosteroid isomerase-like protein